PRNWSQLFLGDPTGSTDLGPVGLSFNGDWFVGVSNGKDTFATGAPWANWGSPASWGQLFAGTQRTDEFSSSRDRGPPSASTVGQLEFAGDAKRDIGGLGFNSSFFGGESNGKDTFVTGPIAAQF